MTVPEIGLLVACAIVCAGLLTACLAMRSLYRRLKKQLNAISERVDHRTAEMAKRIQKETTKLQHAVQKESKNIRSEILNTANAALAASWHTQTRPKRINAALPLVLITQIQRSGGTFLSHLFDGHPEVFAFPHELEWKGQWPEVDPRTDGPLQIARSLVAGNLKVSRKFNLFGYVKELPGAPPSGDQHLPFQWSEWAYVEAFLNVWEKVRPRSRRQCFDVFMSAYFSAVLNLQESDNQKKIITAFGPPMSNAFFEDYPDGLMISICRQPADWYASAMRHRRPYADVEHAMEEWRKSAESAMDLKKRHPHHVVLIPFATLVADPSGVMRCLAERLGLAWHPILSTPTFNGMPIGSNSSFASVVGIDASAVRRRDSLEPELREHIEAQNLAVYEHFLTEADCSSKVTV
jgi:Sulfotransferase family